MHTKAKGDIAETKACEFLKKKGFKIITRNYYTKFGEIDIIAYKNEVYHFIEVKSGTTFEPVYNITPAKLQKIVKSAYVFLGSKRIDSAFCIDAVIVKDGIDFLENLTF